MSEHEFLSASEQLTSFLDGELDPTETSSLFYEIAQNPELQEEMKELILIRNSFRHSMKTPPAHLQNSILASTGLSSGIRAAGGAGTAAYFLKNFLRKPYVAGVLGIAAVATTLFLASNSNDITTENESLNSNIPVISSEEVNSINEDLSSDVVEGYDDEESSVGRSIVNGKFVRQSQTPYNSLNSKDQSDSDVSSSLVNAERNIPVSLIPSDYHRTNASLPSVAVISPNATAIPSIFGDDFDAFLKKLNLDFRIANGTSYPNPDINTGNALLNDFAVALMYNANSNAAFGIEFGRENFMMEFEGYEGDFLYLYPQSYDAFVLGLAFRYRFDELDLVEGVSPYARAFVGGTKIGPLGKISGGLYYNLTHNVVLNGGIEYSLLGYSHMDNVYTTQKLGWTLGLSLGF